MKPKPGQLFIFGGEEPVELPHKTTILPGVVKQIVAHYRREGFPYIALTEDEQVSAFRDLCATDTTTHLEGDVLRSDSTGTSLASMFFPHRYEVRCRDMRTAMEVFSNDMHLEKAIRKSWTMHDGATPSKLRSMLQIFEGVQVPSNFPAGTAKAIYDKYAKGKRVWDPCGGWGGRMLGAAAAGVKHYICNDPSSKTFDGLLRLAATLKKLGAKTVFTVRQSGAEFPVQDEPVALCFTSPPYFNTEVYSLEETQSMIAYPGQGEWIRKFLRAVIDNCFAKLEDGGKLVLNVGNVETLLDLEKVTVKQATQAGFTLFDTKRFDFSLMPGKGNRSIDSSKSARSEALFFFQKGAK